MNANKNKKNSDSYGNKTMNEEDITCDDCKNGICIQTKYPCSGLASTDGSACLMSPNVGE